MAVSDADIAFAQELFAPLGNVTGRKMMGGLSLYHEGTIFAMVHGDGSIWLKGGGDFGATLEAAGSTHWVYSRKDGGTAAMPYWSLPAEALDDPETACDWARRALSHL